MATRDGYPGLRSQVKGQRFRPRRSGPEPEPEGEVAKFLEYAENRVEAIERIARKTHELLERELVDALARVEGGDEAEAAELRSIGEVMSDYSRTVAEWGHEVSEWLKGDAEDRADGELSEGVVLVAHHLAVTGASDEQIVDVLADLGVEDPDAALEYALDQHPRLGSG